MEARAALTAGLIATVVAADGLAATVIPLALENGNAIVEAELGGTPVHLIVDTGGMGTLQLTESTVPRIDVRWLAETTTRTDALGNTFEGRQFFVERMVVGGVTFPNVPGFVRGESQGGVTGRLPADGVLGREFLRPFIARFDYPAGTLTLYRADQRAAADAACRGHPIGTVPHPDDYWVSEAATDHGRMRLIWDSGATYSVVTALAAERFRLPLTDGAYATRRFTLDDSDFGPLEVVVLDLLLVGAEGLLGGNFFATHVVCVDGPRSRVIVERPPAN